MERGRAERDIDLCDIVYHRGMGAIPFESLEAPLACYHCGLAGVLGLDVKGRTDSDNKRRVVSYGVFVLRAQSNPSRSGFETSTEVPSRCGAN